MMEANGANWSANNDWMQKEASHPYIGVCLNCRLKLYISPIRLHNIDFDMFWVLLSIQCVILRLHFAKQLQEISYFR